MYFSLESVLGSSLEMDAPFCDNAMKVSKAMVIITAQDTDDGNASGANSPGKAVMLRRWL